ncbi:MAG: ATP-dependent DNA helicase RecG [Deltaproteobacteria bacterium]|nr:ATP-dependent DNA helicase RecG [Deltaproteobacteria bacterium]
MKVGQEIGGRNSPSSSTATIMPPAVAASPEETLVQYVKGVGPRLGNLLKKLGIVTVADLLWHLPARYLDFRAISRTGMLRPGQHQIVIGTIVTGGIGVLGRRRRRIFEMIVDDGSGPIAAKWFHFHQAYLKAFCVPGSTVMLSGDVSEFAGVPQFVHPEIEVWDEERAPTSAARLVALYPATEGVTQRTLRRVMHNALAQYGAALATILPAALLHAHQLLPRAAAVQIVHDPPPETDLEALQARRSAAHRTLIFEEVFLLELGLAVRRAMTARELGIAFAHDHGAVVRLRAALPFALTEAQDRVVCDVIRDMARPTPMRRMVQGDVGSGKTVIAAMAAAQAIMAGYQVAVMAPTEILAEQHFATMTPWFSALGIPLGFLSGGVRSADRRTMLRQLAQGELPLVVGTHALLEADVHFRQLGLVVVDEQHRFGVEQRLALRHKGTECPDMLILTATPIPRTLAMTAYGDLDLSVIDMMPPGRKPVVTKHYRESQRDQLYAGMRKELSRGHQIYGVYPLVAESEKVDLKNATDMACHLAGVFGPTYPVALLHGQMPGREKEAIMRRFVTGDVKILVTTSVVEVGVDVPNASVMVIEHADRFGLAQLHQLRGRVGRGCSVSGS